MVTLTLIGMTVFTVLLSFMSMTAGTQVSMSALAGKWRWLFLVALWSQVLILPQMLVITPETWKFITAIGIAMLVFCGGANIFDKTDEMVHIISAIVASVCFSIWVAVINPICFLPLVMCVAAGKDKWKWRVETGLIASVYMTLLLSLV